MHRFKRSNLGHEVKNTPLFLRVIFEDPFHVGIKWATQFFEHVFDSKIKCTKLYWCPLLGSFSGLKVDEKDMISTLFFKNAML